MYKLRSLLLALALCISTLVPVSPVDAQTYYKWSGSAYKELNNNKPQFTKAQKKKAKKSFITYKKLDKYDRAKSAIGSVSTDTINDDERAPISSIKPSGWQTVKYPDIVDGNYVYNRCHLLMQKVAAGKKSKDCNGYKNLVTGTRYMNVDGQLPFETKILDYVQSTGNHVLYRVTPIYKGKELVCRAVQMEAWSVEDKGKGLSFNVYCYNVQPGLTINYKTGKVSVSATKTEDMLKAIKNGAVTVAVPEGATDELSENSKGTHYVLNTNTKKFHNPDCSSATSMSAKNKWDGKFLREDLIKHGYEPCGSCKP